MPVCMNFPDKHLYYSAFHPCSQSSDIVPAITLSLTSISMSSTNHISQTHLSTNFCDLISVRDQWREKGRIQCVSPLPALRLFSGSD